MDNWHFQKAVNVVFEQTFLRRAQQMAPYFMGTQPGQLNRQQGTSTIKWRRIEQETGDRQASRPESALQGLQHRVRQLRRVAGGSCRGVGVSPQCHPRNRWRREGQLPIHKYLFGLFVVPWSYINWGIGCDHERKKKRARTTFFALRVPVSS